ncbi:MAG: DUF3418 domain-containing protein, partial [Pseudomonadota bacterium]|nr:DUF3418 domain-containing protein [Pseudomonadota bacterium]
TWDFGDLPATITRRRGQERVTGYPALVDEGDSVAITLLDTAEAAEAATRSGVVRLMRIELGAVMTRYEKGPPGFVASALALKSVVTAEALLQDVLNAICDRAFIGEDAVPRSQAAFVEQVKRARTRLPAVADSAFRLLGSIVTRYQALSQRLGTFSGKSAPLAAQVRARRDALVHPGFFSGTPWSSLTHVPRYLEALERRVTKSIDDPVRAARHAEQLVQWWQRYRERVDKNRQAGRHEPALDDFRWLLEELAVSLFAQELRTPFPVSYKRVEKAWAEIGR